MKLEALRVLAVSAGVLALGVSVAQATGNPIKGKREFKMICAACHSVKAGQNGAAPSLYGVIGRKAGTEAGFHYSSALKKANFVWTPEKVEQWLKGPGSMVPGTAMVVSIANEQERDDIAAYLAQESAVAHKN
jgi:cytochrome c